MGHDKRHYPCECKERVKIKTKKGFQLMCKKCGHGFKEVKRQSTLEAEQIV